MIFHDITLLFKFHDFSTHGTFFSFFLIFQIFQSLWEPCKSYISYDLKKEKIKEILVFSKRCKDYFFSNKQSFTKFWYATVLFE